MRGDQMSRPVALTVLTASALAGLLLLTPTAHASCAQAPPIPEAIDDARHVFVGTVTETTNEGRWATVEVTDVWKGDVGDLVEVRGGPKDPPGPTSVMTSVDRTYKVGQSYLFVPYKARGSVYLDNICTTTTAFKAKLESFDPDPDVANDAAPRPRGPENPTEDPQWWIVGAIAGGAALLAMTLGLRLRARRNHAVSG